MGNEESSVSTAPSTTTVTTTITDQPSYYKINYLHTNPVQQPSSINSNMSPSVGNIPLGNQDNPTYQRFGKNNVSQNFENSWNNNNNSFTLSQQMNSSTQNYSSDFGANSTNRTKNNRNYPQGSSSPLSYPSHRLPQGSSLTSKLKGCAVSDTISRHVNSTEATNNTPNLNDLSHLTPEEKKHIACVMQKAKELEYEVNPSNNDSQNNILIRGPTTPILCHSCSVCLTDESCVCSTCCKHFCKNCSKNPQHSRTDGFQCSFCQAEHNNMQPPTINQTTQNLPKSQKMVPQIRSDHISKNSSIPRNQPPQLFGKRNVKENTEQQKIFLEPNFSSSQNSYSNADSKNSNTERTQKKLKPSSENLMTTPKQLYEPTHSPAFTHHHYLSPPASPRSRYLMESPPISPKRKHPNDYYSMSPPISPHHETVYPSTFTDLQSMDGNSVSFSKRGICNSASLIPTSPSSSFSSASSKSGNVFDFNIPVDRSLSVDANKHKSIATNNNLEESSSLASYAAAITNNTNTLIEQSRSPYNNGKQIDSSNDANKKSADDIIESSQMFSDRLQNKSFDYNDPPNTGQPEAEKTDKRMRLRAMSHSSSEWPNGGDLSPIQDVSPSLEEAERLDMVNQQHSPQPPEENNNLTAFHDEDQTISNVIPSLKRCPSYDNIGKLESLKVEDESIKVQNNQNLNHYPQNEVNKISSSPMKTTRRRLPEPSCLEEPGKISQGTPNLNKKALEELKLALQARKFDPIPRFCYKFESSSNKIETDLKEKSSCTKNQTKERESESHPRVSLIKDSTCTLKELEHQEFQGKERVPQEKETASLKKLTHSEFYETNENRRKSDINKIKVEEYSSASESSSPDSQRIHRRRLPQIPREELKASLNYMANRQELQKVKERLREKQLEMYQLASFSGVKCTRAALFKQRSLDTKFGSNNKSNTDTNLPTNNDNFVNGRQKDLPAVTLKRFPSPDINSTSSPALRSSPVVRCASAFPTTAMIDNQWLEESNEILLARMIRQEGCSSRDELTMRAEIEAHTSMKDSHDFALNLEKNQIVEQTMLRNQVYPTERYSRSSSGIQRFNRYFDQRTNFPDSEAEHLSGGKAEHINRVSLVSPPTDLPLTTRKQRELPSLLTDALNVDCSRNLSTVYPSLLYAGRGEHSLSTSSTAHPLAGEKNWHQSLAELQERGSLAIINSPNFENVVRLQSNLNFSDNNYLQTSNCESTDINKHNSSIQSQSACEINKNDSKLFQSDIRLVNLDSEVGEISESKVALQFKSNPHHVDSKEQIPENNSEMHKQFVGYHDDMLYQGARGLDVELTNPFVYQPVGYDASLAFASQRYSSSAPSIAYPVPQMRQEAPVQQPIVDNQHAYRQVYTAPQSQVLPSSMPVVYQYETPYEEQLVTYQTPYVMQPNTYVNQTRYIPSYSAFQSTNAPVFHTQKYVQPRSNHYLVPQTMATQQQNVYQTHYGQPQMRYVPENYSSSDYATHRSNQRIPEEYYYTTHGGVMEQGIPPEVKQHAVVYPSYNSQHPGVAAYSDTGFLKSQDSGVSLSEPPPPPPPPVGNHRVQSNHSNAAYYRERLNSPCVGQEVEFNQVPRRNSLNHTLMIDDPNPEVMEDYMNSIDYSTRPVSGDYDNFAPKLEDMLYNTHIQDPDYEEELNFKTSIAENFNQIPEPVWNIEQPQKMKWTESRSKKTRNDGGLRYNFPTKRLLLMRDSKDKSFKGNGVGMRIIGGEIAPDGHVGAFVANIFPGGAASRLAGELKERDEIIEWNGICLVNKSFEEVQNLLAAPSDEIEILIRSDDWSTFGDNQWETNSDRRGHKSMTSSYDNIRRSEPRLENPAYYDNDNSKRLPQQRRSQSIKRQTARDYADYPVNSRDYADYPVNSSASPRNSKPSGGPPELKSATPPQRFDIPTHPSKPVPRTASPVRTLRTQEQEIVSSAEAGGAEIVPSVEKKLPPPEKPLLTVVNTENQKMDNEPEGAQQTPHGEVQVILSFDDYDQSLTVHIARAKNLQPMDLNGLADPFVKIRLHPDPTEDDSANKVMWHKHSAHKNASSHKSSESKGKLFKGKGTYEYHPSAESADFNRQTRYMTNTLEPEWQQTVVFMNVLKRTLKKRVLEISVWDYDRLTTNDFMGQANIYLSDKTVLDGKPHWYPLHKQNDVVLPGLKSRTATEAKSNGANTSNKKDSSASYPKTDGKLGVKSKGSANFQLELSPQTGQNRLQSTSYHYHSNITVPNNHNKLSSSSLAAAQTSQFSSSLPQTNILQPPNTSHASKIRFMDDHANYYKMGYDATTREKLSTAELKRSASSGSSPDRNYGLTRADTTDSKSSNSSSVTTDFLTEDQRENVRRWLGPGQLLLLSYSQRSDKIANIPDDSLVVAEIYLLLRKPEDEDILTVTAKSFRVLKIKGTMECYIKFYLMYGEQHLAKVMKRKTRTLSVQENLPLGCEFTINETFTFSTRLEGMLLQVSLWSGGKGLSSHRMLGESVIHLSDIYSNDVPPHRVIAGWYKLLKPEI